MFNKALSVLFVSAVFASTTVVSAKSIEWTAGQLGGGWYSQASGMAKILGEEIPDLSIKVVPGGGTANPLKVARDISQLGMGLDIFLKAAHDGKFLYDKPHKNLRLVGMSFSDIYLHMVAAEDAPYQDMEKLFRKGENVEISVTKAGSSDEQTFRYLLDYYGTDYETLRDERGWKINHLDYAASANQFSDGQVDYTFHALGLPGAAVIQMMQARSAKIMSWPKDLLDALHEKYGYTIAKIPGDAYAGIKSKASKTVKMGTPIMTNSGVPETTIYNITKALCENEKELQSIHASMSVFSCETAGDRTPAPLHQGAKKYYKEQGYL